MKIVIKYMTFLTIFLWLGMSSCNKLNVPPINIVQDKDIFGSSAGVSAYMASLYPSLPVEDFRYNYQSGFMDFPCFNSLGNYTAEMLQANYLGVRGIGTGSFGYWPYTSIRNVNYLLNNLPKYSSGFSSSLVNAWMGEAYFVRAYFYFDLAKRYGGVPLITSLQSYPEQSLDSLQVPRNTETEVYDFVGKDLDSAIKLLPENSLQSGRANKYVAATLKSRAMLYAATIAKYGNIQMNGLLGIPATRANEFFQKSYDAATLLDGKYSLYRKNADKMLNYVNLFLDASSPENIFVKGYKYPDLTHSWDALNIPAQLKGGNGYSSGFNPTLDYVEMFGALVVNDANGYPIRFSSRFDLFRNIEPRLRASVILPGDAFKGDTIDIQRGIYESYVNGDSIGSIKKLHNTDGLYNGLNIIGKSGCGQGSESSVTGFFVRKYMVPDKPASGVLLWQSDQSWIDMRYAEVLLNRAEAAFELGNIQDALACINDIRDRAGAPLLTAATLTLDVIRIERRKELAFENQSWWDIRRWRTADKEFNNKIYHVLYPYYIYDEKKYIYQKELDPWQGRFTFDVKYYYEPIPSGEIGKNPKLKQNPLY